MHAKPLKSTLTVIRGAHHPGGPLWKARRPETPRNGQESRRSWGRERSTAAVSTPKAPVPMNQSIWSPIRDQIFICVGFAPSAFCARLVSQTVHVARGLHLAMAFHWTPFEHSPFTAVQIRSSVYSFHISWPAPQTCRAQLWRALGTRDDTPFPGATSATSAHMPSDSRASQRQHAFTRGHAHTGHEAPSAHPLRERRPTVGAATTCRTPTR